MYTRLTVKACAISLICTVCNPPESTPVSSPRPSTALVPQHGPFPGPERPGGGRRAKHGQSASGSVHTSRVCRFGYTCWYKHLFHQFRYYTSVHLSLRVHVPAGNWRYVHSHREGLALTDSGQNGQSAGLLRTG